MSPVLMERARRTRLTLEGIVVETLYVALLSALCLGLCALAFILG